MRQPVLIAERREGGQEAPHLLLERVGRRALQEASGRRNRIGGLTIPLDPSAAEIVGDAGDVDEDCDMRAGCYANGDEDGYRTDMTLTSADADCTDAGEAREALPSGTASTRTRRLTRGAGEVDGDADDLDENCDGAVTCYANADGDGYQVATVLVSSMASKFPQRPTPTVPRTGDGWVFGSADTLDGMRLNAASSSGCGSPRLISSGSAPVRARADGRRLQAAGPERSDRDPRRLPRCVQRAGMGLEIGHRWLICGVLLVTSFACDGAPSGVDCGDGNTVPASARCDRSYDCADRRDEASCRYNGSADENPIDSWDFDPRAAMESALAGAPNADAQFISAALSAHLTPAELDHIANLDWSVATPDSIIADPALGHAFQAIILHYDAEVAVGSRTEPLRRAEAGDIGARVEAQIESCGTATEEVRPGVQDGIDLVGGVVLAGVGGVALGAAACVVSVVCGVIAATAVVAGVVMALNTAAGRAIRELALANVCASEDGICGTCSIGDCTCPPYCERPAGCEAETCGDGECEAGEETACPDDCGSTICGDGRCDMGEMPTCPEDCDAACPSGALDRDGLCCESGTLDCAGVCDGDAQLSASGECCDPSTGSCCGDGVVQAGEECDGADLDGSTCGAGAYAGRSGTLRCQTDCRVDESACVAPDCDTDLDGAPDVACGPDRQCLRVGIEGATGAVAMRRECFPRDSFECVGTASSGDSTAPWVRVCTGAQTCLMTRTNLHTSMPGATPHCVEPGSAVCDADPNNSAETVCGPSEVCACNDPAVRTDGEACFAEPRRNCMYELSPGVLRCWSCPSTSTAPCAWGTPPRC